MSRAFDRLVAAERKSLDALARVHARSEADALICEHVADTGPSVHVRVVAADMARYLRHAQQVADQGLDATEEPHDG